MAPQARGEHDVHRSRRPMMSPKLAVMPVGHETLLCRWWVGENTGRQFDS
jgi:hypothetical protein